MSVLTWDAPQKAVSTEEWRRRSANDAPPGVYTPNMSRQDMDRWKAKRVGGRDPRVEIRKSVSYQEAVAEGRSRCHSAQILMIVRPDRTNLSMNGTAVLTSEEMEQTVEAYAEARAALSAGESL